MNSALTVLFGLQSDRKINEMLGNVWERMKNNSENITLSSVPWPFSTTPCPEKDIPELEA